MRLKLVASLLISVLFTCLAFRGIDFAVMWRTLRQANYWLLAPTVLLMYVSLCLRAVRWGYFMKPIRTVAVRQLFAAMMIGYYGNNVFPFRLGEVLRAYAIGKSAGVSRMASFATIFVERIVDVISLLLLLGVSLLFHDYPAWIERGGALLLAVTVVCTVFIVFLMERTEKTLAFVTRLMRFFPVKVQAAVRGLLASFLEGFGVFKRTEHYWSVVWQSLAIWLCYAAIVFVTLEAFDLNRQYQMPPGASLVILVMTSIAIMVPAAPGYVGSFHWVCQQALVLFGVSASESLGFAVVSHVVNFIPITLLGFYYYYRQHLHLHEAVARTPLDPVAPDNAMPPCQPATHNADRQPQFEENVTRT
ncbi:MAG: flippase-like domain-containing protein [candidate division KSB1 bacterium]|nr:flippase-like domain-containing protein [candidate division KSB1 bacterium]MDZ7275586.1 flippase-like domain-containing protein [candidate division KSB1 bacterium]MDZ7284723.1 flippase-like domain-containing protein [candidate division KSB1 bacterium]MDZ7297858.1 flippase-like domain-containing protein [candidate division KSB1 bacterium]MDZ7348723.1 flippase-like domain-containing protein [candidate division KSB1 bacterium]